MKAPVSSLVMRFLILLGLLLVAAQDPSLVAITSPASGSVISGEVTVTGTTDVLGFASSQLDFSYASNPTDTWFALQTSTQPEIDSPLAVWDTTLLSDGEYVLRLRVYLDDGSFEDVTVTIRVQNDSPILTPTVEAATTPDGLDILVPTPFLMAASPTPTLTPRPTPTPLATNAAALDQTSIYTSFGRGVLVILGLFVIAGIILRFRRY